MYLEYGRDFGSTLGKGDVKRRFKTARRKLFSAETPAQEQTEGALTSSDAIEKELWRRFIDFVFDDVADSTELFDALWHFFAVPENWRVFTDVAECLSQLKQRGYYVAIASNFDSRLIPIVDHFKELSAFDDVFCSASLGFRKPDPAFYQQALQKVSRSLGAQFPPEEIVFVGDCIENDFHGPRRMGWSAFWLDRAGEPGGEVDCPPTRRLTSLAQLSAALI